MSYDVKSVVTQARIVKLEKGNMLALVRHFHPGIAEDSEECKIAKRDISQLLTQLRKTMVERLVKEQKLSEEDAKAKVLKVIPSFRGRSANRAKAIDSFMDELMALEAEENAIGEDDDLEDDFDDFGDE